MNMSLNKRDVEDIAITLSTEPVFLEKDFHVSRIVEAHSQITHSKFSIVFCGGTSLLQGYQLINRFSEDADFRLIYKDSKAPSRGELRDFRKIVLDKIKEIPDLKMLEDTLVSRDSSRFFSIMIKYKKQFGDHHSLRPEIKLDCTFTDHFLDGIEAKETACVIAKYLALPKPSIPCLSLIETTADKASALIWRVLGRDRNNPDDDVTIIRHLHDLTPLLEATQNDLGKVKTHLLEMYQIDHKRGGQVSSEPSIAAKEVLHILKTDKLYRQEYENYVLNMCFGDPDQRISFDMALKRFEKLVESL